MTHTFVSALVSNARDVQLVMNILREPLGEGDKQRLEALMVPVEGMHVTIATALEKLGTLNPFERQIAERLAEIKFED